MRIVLAAFVFATPGCSKLGLGNDNNPVAPSGPPAAGATIVYTAIGASDAVGVGSSVLCPLADCPNGTSYVAVAARTLRNQGFTVTLRNLGIPTAVIGPDFQSLGQQYDRTIVANFIDQEMPFILANSTVVTILAGVNDVLSVVTALGAGAGGSNQSAYIDQQISNFTNDYATLVKGIRDRAPGARIVVLNVPNVAALPYFTSAAASQRQAQQKLSVGFTTRAINPLAGQGVIVVDSMCDARSYMPSNYSSDFHPNDAGYAYIGAEIVRAITSASYPAPAGSCGAMSIVP